MIKVQFNLRDLQLVAALYCEGMTKQNIAYILSADDDYVQKMIEEAELRDYFTYEPKLTLDVLNPEVRELVYNEVLTDALCKTLKKKLEFSNIPVSITPSPVDMFTKYKIDAKVETEDFKDYTNAEWESVRIVGNRASQELSKILFDGEDHIIGLNWGTIVEETINNVSPLPSQISANKIKVISLFGDLEFHSPKIDISLFTSVELNCNKLVNRLVQRLGGQAKAVQLNVPGFIPEQFSKNKDTFEAIKFFLTSHNSYKKIFGTPPSKSSSQYQSVTVLTDRSSEAMISSVDTIITGFGSADNYTVLSEYLRSWLSSEEIKILFNYSRDEKIAGDIGGHLLASPLAKDDHELANFLKKLNRRILATQPNDFIDVASRHIKSGKGAGVMGMAVGARKAKILYTLLSQNPCPISRLVIDSHCALALLHLIDPAEFKAFVRDRGGKLVEKHSCWSEETKKFIPV